MFFLIKFVKFVVIYIVFIITKESIKAYDVIKRVGVSGDSKPRLVERTLRVFKTKLKCQLGLHKRILTSYSYLATFLFFIVLNTLVFILRPVFIFIIWLPHWIFKFNAYLWKSKVSELKPNLENKWTSMFFYFKFSNYEDRNMGKLSICFRYWFLNRANAYSYFRVYNIIYVSLQRITNMWLGKYNVLTLLLIFIVVMSTFFLVFVIEICLGPLRIFQLSAFDTDRTGGTLLLNGIHESLLRTIQGFIHREIEEIPGKRIYKDNNSLFNFNPSHKHSLMDIRHRFSSMSEVKNYIESLTTGVDQFVEYCDLFYAGVGNSRLKHVHLTWPVANNTFLNTNLTSAENEDNLVNILGGKMCDTNFSFLKLNLIKKDLTTKPTILSPVNLIQMGYFKTVDENPEWLKAIDNHETRRFITTLMIYQLFNRNYILNYSEDIELSNPLKTENVVKFLIANRYGSLEDLVSISIDFENSFNNFISELLEIPLDQVKINHKAQFIKADLISSEANPILHNEFVNINNINDFGG